MSKFLAICQNTFTQTIRQPVYGILILATMAILVMSVPLAVGTLGEAGGDFQTTDQKMLEGLGLSTLLVSGFLAAIFSASSAVSREIEDKTALTVISKPVRRFVFVLGKFAGVAGAVALSFYLTGLVMLMTICHHTSINVTDTVDWPVIVLGLSALAAAVATALAGNYFFGWPFTATGVWAGTAFLSVAMGLIAFIGRGWVIVPFGRDIRPELLTAILLNFMAVLVFVAAAIAISTRASQITTLLVTGALFCLGSIHPAFDVWAPKFILARLLAWIIPNLNYFFMVDAMSRTYQSMTIPASYTGMAAVYCFIYVAVALAIGIALFQNREPEGQGGSTGIPRAVSVLAWAGRIGAIVFIAAGVEGVLVLAVRLGAPAIAAQTVTPGWAAGGLLVGTALWMLWGGFGRGVRWTHRTVAGLTILGLLIAAAGAVVSDSNRTACIARAIAAAVILGLLLLPSTRRHFSNP